MPGTWVEYIMAAHQRIGPHVYQTPLIEAPALSAELDCEVFLKLENLQKTGSFKLRGALNAVLQLSDEERSAGIITASSGNHGAAVSRAVALAGGQAHIYVPVGTSETKATSIRRYGGILHFEGAEAGESEAYARALSSREGRTYVSPYNDAAVIAGQGTIAMELAEQLPDMDAVMIAVGGGGLASGISTFLKSLPNPVTTYGCSPEASATMIDSIEAGRVIETSHLPTLSDGTAGGIEAGSLTFALCRDNLDQLTKVSEQALANAMRAFLLQEHLLVEGAAALTLAVARQRSVELKGKKVVFVICGGNVSETTLRQVFCQPPAGEQNA